jgi:2-keto-4-pentenoate hydratase/2-oxohepta-3-ene-1,7-dioic acid hydratase in catechol pathway
MRLATFTLTSDPNRARIGALSDGKMLDLAHCAELSGFRALPGSMRGLLASGRIGLATVAPLLESPQAAALHALEDVTFLPPIPDPEKFLCVGKNYRSHVEELERSDLIKETPEEPTGFVKLNSSLTGHETDVVRPHSVAHLDYEPELVFVIGRPAHRAKRSDAFNHVIGITLLNDLTCRETQKREVASGSRFWTSKNAPGFGPLGPWIITMDEVPDPYDIWITCTVNGEQRMRVNTHEQIWKLPDIIEHFSRLVPLAPGDMFSTGAPGGVAVGRPNAEELFLKPGDVVECTFESPAMVLRNRIVAPH